MVKVAGLGINANSASIELDLKISAINEDIRIVKLATSKVKEDNRRDVGRTQKVQFSAALRRGNAEPQR